MNVCFVHSSEYKQKYDVIMKQNGILTIDNHVSSAHLIVVCTSDLVVFVYVVTHVVRFGGLRFFPSGLYQFWLFFISLIPHLW